MQINADLHIHSKYSMATSPRMELPVIAREARKKGIQLLGSGDCLHPQWRRELTQLQATEDTLTCNDTYFIPTVEVEDTNHVHHLLLIPSLSKAEELYETLKKHSQNIDTDGRPTLNLTGEDIAQLAKDTESLIGPAHAFTPWTALYAYHNSLTECYGTHTKYISFIELGLSADTSYADHISELHHLTYLTNSDAHSPWPNKLAREFTRFKMNQPSFDELKKAIHRQEGRKPVLNVGLFPQEGKYNESACIKCFKHYTLKEAITSRWQCKCGGKIKKGVRDRIEELTDTHTTPPHRPPYLHIFPLTEIISMALKHTSTNTKAVQSAWEKLITTYRDEVSVLVDAELNSINNIDPRITKAIKAFREGRVILHPGGGGRYGHIELPENHTENKNRQHTLQDFQ